MLILSNCNPLDWGNYPKLGFEFSGQSMTNFSTMEAAEKSIYSKKESKTIVFCDKANIIEGISKETISIEGKYVCVMSFFDKPFIAEVAEVTGSFITFRFLNPDKEQFPNQYLRKEEIISIHMVEQIQYDGRITVFEKSNMEGGASCL